MKREFLMLAEKLIPEKVNFCSYYASEKMDGVRCYWDGGLSRGLLADEVPWCNTAKHDRYKTRIMATGLWTRYGQPIQAPEWFLNHLPRMPLDGELWAGRGNYQQVTSTVRKLEPIDWEWERIKYAVFDSPSYEEIFSDGRINNSFYKKSFQGIGNWINGRLMAGLKITELKPRWFCETLKLLQEADLGSVCEVVAQNQIPSMSRQAAVNYLETMLKAVVDEGGEGLMLRCPTSTWSPCRTQNLLKYKPFNDTEGVVVGYKWASPTDLDRSLTGQKTDKLLGLMGSITVKLDSGVEFDLSGFTEAERVMKARNQSESTAAAQALCFGAEHPGQVIPIEFQNDKFPRGSRITIRYRELTNDGKPKEARYLRPRNDNL